MAIHGHRPLARSILGLETGLMLQLTLVAVGLGAAVASSIVAFNAIKWIGVAYLGYLAVRQWRSVTTPSSRAGARLLPRGAAAVRPWTSS